jgi:hypothetical protein
MDDAQCQCFKSTPSAFELVSAGLSPTPNTTAWLVFSDSSTKPTVSGSGYLATGANYVALDLCQASGKSSRCTFADPNAQDDCSRLPSNVAQSVRDLYCGSGALFGAQDDASSLCAGKISGSQSECLGGSSLASKYMFKPSGLQLTVSAFSVPDVDCWTLSCKPDGIFASNDKTTTYNPNSFTAKGVIEIDALQISMDLYAGEVVIRNNGCLFCSDYKDYSGLYTKYLTQNSVKFNMQYDGSAAKRLMTYKTAWCARLDTRDTAMCSFNTFRTRQLSSQFATTDSSNYNLLDTTTYSFMTLDKMKTVIADTLKGTEDFFSLVRPSPACMENPIQPGNLSYCVNDKYSISASSECSYTEKLEEWNARVPFICNTMRRTNIYMNNFCSKRYQNNLYCKEDGSDNDDGTSAYDKCVWYLRDSYFGFGDQINYKCTKVTYRVTFDDSCNRTKRACPYTEADQATMVDAGLPKSGFCPTCVPPAACQSTKPSDTYARMKSNIYIHNIMPRS